MTWNRFQGALLSECQRGSRRLQEQRDSFKGFWRREIDLIQENPIYRSGLGIFSGYAIKRLTSDQLESLAPGAPLQRQSKLGPACAAVRKC